MKPTIDLSQPVTAGMQVFPGDPPVATETVASVAHDGFRVSSLHLGSHTGTHVDAPAHVLDGGAAVDEVELARFHGRAHVIRVPGARSGHGIGLDQVSEQLEPVQENDIVLVETGWSRFFGHPEYLRHPFLAPAVATALLNRGVRSVGIDTLSPDPTVLSPDPTVLSPDPTVLSPDPTVLSPDGGPAHLPFHATFLGAGGVIFENLCNLAAVPTPCLFVALPLRLTGLDGSPVRAVAIPEPAATFG